MKSFGMIAMLSLMLLACDSPKKGYPSSALTPKLIDGEHYVYVLPTGEQAFEEQFDYATEFEDGYAIISDSNDLCGIIDSTGTIILPYSYSDLWFAGEGMYSFRKNYLIGFIDRRGNVRIPPIYGGDGGASPRFSEGVCAVIDSTNSYYIFIDKNGRKAIDIKIEGTLGGAGTYYFPEFHDGLCVAHDKYKFGYIDHAGKWAIPPQFDQAHRFGDGLAAVRKKGLVMFINTKGERAIARSFGAIDEGCCGFDYGFFQNGKARVNLDSTQSDIDIDANDSDYDYQRAIWGIIDTKGNILEVEKP
jgi:hypothetical protein